MAGQLRPPRLRHPRCVAGVAVPQLPVLGVTSRSFGVLPDGATVECITVCNGQLRLSALTYGAIISSLRLAAADEPGVELVLGFDHLEPYVDNSAYVGALVGRYANRIRHGRFFLDGVGHQLATNDGAHHLHGGPRGFSRQVWTWLPVVVGDACGVCFARTSPAGEEQYPGTMQVEVRYLLTPDNRVLLDYTARTDRPTIVNLTQHSYFNLEGESSTSVLRHELTVHATRFTPVGPGLIPAGALAPVADTPFDFSQPTRILDAACRSHPQLIRAGGFDHNFALDGDRTVPAPAAVLRDPRSGRTLRIATTEPGLQFYDGHLLNGRMAGAGNRLFVPHAGLCLETQHFPDSPNRPGFPSTALVPGVEYRSSTVWQLSTT